MAKLTLTDIVTGYGSANLLNANNALIEAALENTLSLDGTTPNSMGADFDLDDNDILNGGTITCAELTVAGSSVAASVAAAAASAAAAATSETNAATSETNAGTSETNAGASATLASQWASLTGALVAATDYSSKEYAIGTFTRGSVGSAKDWATLTGTTVNATEVSAREWARGTYNLGLANGGSARMWATNAEDSLVDDSGYSAFHWAQKAMAIVGTANVAVSSNDTTMDYLGNKLIGQHGLEWDEVNDGGDEDYRVGIGSHLEIGGGANNYELNIYTGDSLETVAHFTNLTTGNTSVDGTKFGINSAEQAVLWNYEATHTLFGTSNLTRMSLASGGQLSVGPSTLTNELVNLYQAGSTDVDIRFQNGATGTGAAQGLSIGLNTGGNCEFRMYDNSLIQFLTNNTTAMTIAADQGVTTGGAASQGAGSIAIDSSADYYKGSNKLLGRGALARNTSTQAITTATLTAVNFGAEDYDTDTIHDNATNNSRLSVPSGVTKVRLTACIAFATNATGERQISFDKNGAGTWFSGGGAQRVDAAGAGQTHLTLTSSIIEVVGGTDYFEVTAYQNSGGNLNVQAGNQTWFSMEIIE